MNQAFFLTGTDTGIGKTFASCALLHAWRAQGFTAAGFKPVASGLEETPAGLVNEDVLALHAASSPGFALTELNSFALREPASPHLAAELEGVRITAAPILARAAQLRERSERLLVEGVGGFQVPLAPGLSSADLASLLDLPVLLVVGIRLGCINHALLTAAAIRARGLHLAGWIANEIDPAARWKDEQIMTIDQDLACPLLGRLPFDPQRNAQRAAQFLQLPAPTPSPDC